MAQKSETRCGEQRVSINLIDRSDEMNDESVPKIRSASEFVDELLATFANEEHLRPLRQAVRAAGTWGSRLSAIRSLYEAYEALGEDYVGDPYSLELQDYWTPIEWRLWQDIRSAGRLNFVPQFPVGPYFLDFADPARQVGLEADGKRYHRKQKDTRRDEILWKQHGWKVFRVTGAECYRVRPSPWEFERNYYEKYEEAPSEAAIRDAASAFFSSTSAGVVRAMRIYFTGGSSDSARFSKEVTDSLRAHRLAMFPMWGDD